MPFGTLDDYFFIPDYFQVPPLKRDGLLFVRDFQHDDIALSDAVQIRPRVGRRPRVPSHDLLDEESPHPNLALKDFQPLSRNDAITMTEVGHYPAVLRVEQRDLALKGSKETTDQNLIADIWEPHLTAPHVAGGTGLASRVSPPIAARLISFSAPEPE